ncbi:unnamed protein product [Rotaria magnacalcarata]|uniref:Nuclear receptor domain-containing protein n=2 Tax=Rotaria magnacalcarata TaxID=392030 RepID=A0A816SUQ7_9BILA|nr:unnamed protein product [Rotaria magnacalcarata]CAF1630722.1 unnamed protein product [Rotaria magnacalcarata]CAF2093022.1 unnamed protein product [Rotaria magnacalcarata]
MDDLLTGNVNTTREFSSNVGRQTSTVLSKCKICDAPARYSYYGVVACHSCKMFFKRNAENGQEVLTCHFGYNCDINMNSRHTCASCRLTKCLINGMRIEMIRASRCKRTKRNNKRKLNIDSIALLSMSSNNRDPTSQNPTLNLLDSNQSTLSIDKWNFLSNLVRCFDENSGYKFVADFIEEQSALPLKLRFKYSSVNPFFASMMSKVQLVFEKNRDFLLLSQHDRTVLLKNTVEYTATIGGMFILRQSRLLDDFSFSQSAEMIFQPSGMIFIKRVIDQFDSDDTFIKLILTILAFATINYTVYRKNIQINLTNMKVILPIQDMYTELTWQYLVDKYGHLQAVKRFSNLLKCLFSVTKAIVEVHQVQKFTDIINSIIEQTEETNF